MTKLLIFPLIVEKEEAVDKLLMLAYKNTKGLEANRSRTIQDLDWTDPNCLKNEDEKHSSFNDIENGVR